MAKTPTKEDEFVEKKPVDAVPVDEPIKTKIKGGGHIKPSDMRKDVENTVLADLSEDVDSARAPYPTGSPRDPDDIFEEQHGYRKGS